MNFFRTIITFLVEEDSWTEHGRNTDGTRTEHGRVLTPKGRDIPAQGKQGRQATATPWVSIPTMSKTLKGRDIIVLDPESTFYRCLRFTAFKKMLPSPWMFVMSRPFRAFGFWLILSQGVAAA